MRDYTRYTKGELMSVRSDFTKLVNGVYLSIVCSLFNGASNLLHEYFAIIVTLLLSYRNSVIIPVILLFFYYNRSL